MRESVEENTDFDVRDRQRKSANMLEKLSDQIKGSMNLEDYPGLVIFVAGSYARGEAGDYSDCDIFLVHAGDTAWELPRTKEVILISSIIRAGDKLGLPKFSSDCKFIKIIDESQLLEHLGGSEDDYENYFTTRMLLLLESKCIYGEEHYQRIKKSLIRHYFKDFDDHGEDFVPLFLINDIARYWKTIALNYENYRGKSLSKMGLVMTRAEKKMRIKKDKIEQQVKSFKLKHSRINTCFATIAALWVLCPPMENIDVIDQVCQITDKSPRERIRFAEELCGDPEGCRIISELDLKYEKFLSYTGLPTQNLEARFTKRKDQEERETEAREYGDLMFEFLKVIDRHRADYSLIRFLAI